MDYTFKPVGIVESCFKFKNGTPRQPTVCGQARAKITIDTEVYSNPDHSLIGLEEFSHVWVIFVFHQNNNAYKKAKVKPPRLNGAKVGVFSTRSPYRLNNIGLTLAKIEGIEGATLHLSGIDMLDGTPVLDIKPYIPLYDKPQAMAASPFVEGANAPEPPLAMEENLQELQPEVETNSSDGEVMLDDDADNGQCLSNDSAKNITVPSLSTIASSAVPSPAKAFSRKKKPPGKQKNKGHEPKESEGVNAYDKETGLYVSKDLPPAGPSTFDGDSDKPKEGGDAEYANWIKAPPFKKLTVRFTRTANEQLNKFSVTSEDEQYRLDFMKSQDEARTAITNILEADPRSSYRRKKCVDRLYFFMVDVFHVTCWFNDDEDLAEVVRIKPNKEKMMQKLAGQK